MINKYVKLACEGILVVSFFALACSKKDASVIPTPERKANLAGTEVVNANPHYTQCLEAKIVHESSPDASFVYFKGGIAGLGNYSPGTITIDALVEFTPICKHQKSGNTIRGLSKQKHRNIKVDFYSDKNGSYIFNHRTGIIDEEDLKACPGINYLFDFVEARIVQYQINFSRNGVDAQELTRANGQECLNVYN